jgi:4-hydroxythreonine-4-phosphate dehydrogenase
MSHPAKNNSRNPNPDRNPNHVRNTNHPRPLIGVTMGDPRGIGAEVTVKALADPQLRSLARFVIFGTESILLKAAKRAGVAPFWFHRPYEDVGPIDSGVLVANFPRYDSISEEARPSVDGGEASIAYLDAAIEAAEAGVIQAIVTGPINKESWLAAGCTFPGHTEKLAAAFNAKRVTMMFEGGGLRVALASTHLPLFDLRNRFTIGLVFQPIDLLHTALQDWWGIEHPRIAVAGLNPHAGEAGRFGDEEERVIEPALTMARQAGIDVDGPFPGDTLFVDSVSRRYDGLVAMYHDQGLIPVKVLAFNSAVNITLGLPIIRTSVDHGTGFDIAGTNQADPGSMTHALRLAVQLACVAHPSCPVDSASSSSADST